MIKRATCKKGHPMEPPNLIEKTVKGREVRECRTCANARFREMRKNKRNKGVDETSGKAFNGSQPIQQPDPLEEIVKELDEHPAEVCTACGAAMVFKHPFDQQKSCSGCGTSDPTVAEVDPMEFLEESAPKPALDEVEIDFLAEHETEKITDQVAYADAPAELEAYTLPVTITDCNAKDLSLEFKEAIAVATESMTQERAQEIAKAEVAKAAELVNDARVETLTAPHGAKVAIPAPKLKPRYGCEHGFQNPHLCPQCRAGKGR